MNGERLTLLGVTASPYTQKMIAVLRYRHIPYSVLWGDAAQTLERMGIEKPRPILYPVFLFKQDNGDLHAQCDSTPIIRQLERDYRTRSIIPQDSALAFIDYLIEDYADEWLTKAMFHYRWAFDDDIDNAGTLLPLALNPSLDNTQHSEFKKMFSKRQVDRRYVVGSSAETAPIIESSYSRFLSIFNDMLSGNDFVLGAKPSAADFAIYGQLTQLIGFDPTSRAIAYRSAPRVIAWLDRVADLSGLPDSQDRGFDEQSSGLKALLCEIGQTYVPTMLANEQAFNKGEKEFQARFDGVPWKQPVFPYQAKCLQWVREQYQGLSAEDALRVHELLQETGCELLL